MSKAKDCGRCERFAYYDGPNCAKGHKPRFYEPTIAVDVTDWGYKRICNDYKERKVTSKHPHAQLRSVMKTAESWSDKAYELEAENAKLKLRLVNLVACGNNLANNAHEQLVSVGNEVHLRTCVDEWEELLDAIRDLNK